MSLKYKYKYEYKAHLQGSGSVFTMVIPMFLCRLLEIRERKGVMYVIMEGRVGTLKGGSMTGKERELTDMERRKIELLCVHEARWKGSKASSTGSGLFYFAVERKWNGVGVILKNSVRQHHEFEAGK